ncbi:MAG: hypothetical protein VW804_07435, partial [Verrucomicrobiota bacterium]
MQGAPYLFESNGFKVNHAQAIQYLYELRTCGSKMGLARMLEWAERLGNPQNNLRFIHVAGTNGKGSVCAYLEKIYLQAGLRVSCFTSPH